MNIQTDRAFVGAGESAVRYCTVTITAPSPPADPARPERPAARVALVLDRSGSMAGRKLEMARKAVDHALRLLTDRDRVAVVCYDHEVDVLLAIAPASAEAKGMAAKRLKEIDARGNTDLAAGWARGRAEVATAADAKSSDVARVLLLSDGLANEGETNHDVLGERAAALRSQGIVTSTFGVGVDFDEVLMSKMATQGGGHFYFIEQPAQIPDFFASELGETLNVVARDARLVIANGPGTQTTCLNDFPGVAHADGLHIRLGDLSAGDQLTLVLATTVAPRTEGDAATIQLRLSDRDQALFAGPMDIAWAAVDVDANRAQPVNTDVILAAAVLVAERARAEALELNRAGNFKGAKELLESVAERIRAMAPDSEKVRAVAAELEHAAAEFAAPMDPLAMKASFSRANYLRRSRDPQGSARKSS